MLKSLLVDSASRPSASDSCCKCFWEVVLRLLKINVSSSHLDDINLRLKINSRKTFSRSQVYRRTIFCFLRQPQKRASSIEMHERLPLDFTGDARFMGIYFGSFPRGAEMSMRIFPMGYRLLLFQKSIAGKFLRRTG
jgi:hypothetical protein